MILEFTLLILCIAYIFKKYRFNSVLRPRNTIFIICLFCISFQLNAQQDTIRIPLNSSIPFSISPNAYEFDLEIKKNKKIRFNSEKINAYKFNKPGISKIYPISTHKHSDVHDCSIIHLPDTITILTDSFNIVFIDSTFRLSNQIFKNINTKGTFVEIEVYIETYKEINTINLTNNKLFTAGIGLEITGTLDSNYTKVKKGKNILRYNLEGICRMNSYIQFDFINNVGKAHSISLNSPIKDN